MKWITHDNPSVQGHTFTIINHGMLIAKNETGAIKGLTVFEPRDFSKDFLTRLDQRRLRPEFKGHQFHLFLPPYLKHRVENLTAQNQTPEITYTPFLNIKFAEKKVIVRDRIRVVNVDDSPVLLKFLKHTLDSMGFIDVVQQVSDPHQAVAQIQKFTPDLVTMDIQMPGKTGVSVVQDLLSVDYFPVLMISSLAMEEGSLVFEALNAGAFDYLQKPKLEEKEEFKEDLSAKSLLAVSNGRATKRTPKAPSKKSPDKTQFTYPANLLWCIGASTGGTQALTQVFTSLPTEIPPTLIVQHIPPVFSKAFAESLNNLVPFKVKEAENGEWLLPNHAYIAPGGLQMGVEESAGKWRIVISDDPPVNRFKPSVDYMFSKASKLSKANIVAGVMTGMGRDGAKGLLDLKNGGARTFVQDEASSAVYGMPRAAFEIGATQNIVPLDTIAQTLLEQSLGFRKTG